MDKRGSGKRSFGASATKKEVPFNLVGRIVEKGFASKPQQKADPASLPKPTVFSFPVARHRSHGPHWSPLGSEMDDEDDNEDKDETDFEPIAAFAHPIPRKQKKGLDFSNWKELVPEDSCPVNQKLKADNFVHVLDTGEEKGGKEAAEIAEVRNGSQPGLSEITATSHEKVNTGLKADNSVPVLDTGEGMGGNEATETAEVRNRSQPGLFDITASSPEKVNTELQTNSNVDLMKSSEAMEIGSQVVVSDLISEFEQHGSCSIPIQEFSKDDGTVPQNNLGGNFEENEERSLSVMNEIDAENCAILQNMSPEEIAEAQAEIMEKMPSRIIQMLKKRGQEKLETRRSVKSDLHAGQRPAAAHDKINLRKDDGSAPPVEDSRTTTNSSNMVQPTKYSTNRPENGGRELSSVPDSSSWNLWAERVEKVRAMRFSLDGSVVESDSVQAPGMANISERNQYNVENVAERDFLRTEGDPGAAGYTIKEAVALVRSMVPGQRALALQLLASVLDRALCNFQQSDVGFNKADANGIDKFVDWQAVWAFALGPEPELVLSLRMSLDDNHMSVVLACAKVIQCILSCDMNEKFINITEKMMIYDEDICTAPVFRHKPEINVGFLKGGFWKYSIKPSNILPFSDVNGNDENEEERTIQDDNVVAGQDVAAGLVRMGILPRICYLLEMDPVAALEECLITILIGLARHSPTCADAVMNCPRLLQTIVNRFMKNQTMEVHPSMIKSVTLLKVLAQYDKKNCEYFIKHGIFRDTMWHLYRCSFSINQWIKSGKDSCKLTSCLMIEQLRFWKVCICYGCCISYFADFFPGMCLWLNPPTFDKLIESNVLVEYTSIARECYATLEALARQLPYLHAEKQLKKQSTHFSDDNIVSWSWSHVVPMVELAMKWMSSRILYQSSNFSWHKVTTNNAIHDSSFSSLLWVISAVMHMLCSIFERMVTEDINNLHESNKCVPWLPEFVPKLSLEIVKNGWFNLLDARYIEQKRDSTRGNSIVEDLCSLRCHRDFEASLASVCCLHGLIRLTVLADKSIQAAKHENTTPCHHSHSREDKIVEEGMVMWYQDELKSVLKMFLNLVLSGWDALQPVEMFGRGGPAPGIGLGWGVIGGGFWSRAVLIEQMDSRLVMCLLEVFPIVLEKGLPAGEDMNFALQRVNSMLVTCLIAGPRDKLVLEKALDFLLQDNVLKFLDFCVRHFLCLNKGVESFRWEHKDEDFVWFGKILKSHFRSRWLTMKRKSSGKINKEIDHKTNQEKCEALETIHEDLDVSEKSIRDSHSSLVIEWAHQRLPLPIHWFLSPMTTSGCDEAAHPTASSQDYILSLDVLDVAKSGLFLLIGLEATSLLSCSDISQSPVLSVPLVWKFHALSMLLLVKMETLEEEKYRDIYGTLQDLYGKLLDQSRCRYIKPLPKRHENLLPEVGKKDGSEFLMFKTDIHESYTTFIETLIEQFSAVSYGDEIYGRQVALYLHRSVEVPVRLAAWNALSNTHVLELLPPLGKCIAEAEGYLQPVEDSEGILDAYVKSWISGCLERAALRGSMSFTLVLHHLSSFIFATNADDKLPLRKKLARSLLRDYSRTHKHEGMMLSFVRYNLSTQETELKDDSLAWESEIRRRFELLSEACEGNSALLIEVEKLKSSK